jgi:hypothetical protein
MMMYPNTIIIIAKDEYITSFSGCEQKGGGSPFWARYLSTIYHIIYRTTGIKAGQNLLMMNLII